MCPSQKESREIRNQQPFAKTDDADAGNRLLDMGKPIANVRPDEWPWGGRSSPAAEGESSSANWPLVSIVTPSFNQSDFLERTIRSVLLQDYPRLEYIIIDGGSTDSSVDIMKHYSPWLKYWVSEPDGGQAEAINKGFSHASGLVMAYLNSDDFYEPGAIMRAVKEMERGRADIVIGAVNVFAEDGRHLQRVSPNHGPPFHRFPIFANGRMESFFFTQPSMFWRRSIWEATGGIDVRYHYVMDREWCTRALAVGAVLRTFETDLAGFLLHPGSKSHDDTSHFMAETTLMYRRFATTPGFRWWPCMAESLYARLRFLQTFYMTRSAQFRHNGKSILSFRDRFLSGVFRRTRKILQAAGDFARWRQQQKLT